MVTKESKYKKLLSDMGLFAVGTFGSKILLFLLIPLYTNVLTDSEYGIADLVFTVSDLILPVISITIYNGLLRYGLIESKKNDAIRISLLYFVGGSVLVLLLTPVIGLYSPVSEWKWLLSFKIIASFAYTVSLIILKIKDKNKGYAIISILQSLLLVVSNLILLLWLRQGTQGYIWSSILSLSVSAVLAFLLSGAPQNLKASVRNLPLFREMSRYSVPFVLNDISWWLIHSSDKIMIEWLLDSSLLGLYTAASKIPSLINSVTSIFTQAWGIASIREYDAGNDRAFYSRIFRIFQVVIFGICLLIIPFTKLFIGFYVGANFYESWRYVPLLLTSACFASISAFAGSLFGALKKSGSLMVTTVISAVVNVLVNYTMIPVWGVFGAVAGTVAAYLVVAAGRLILLRKYIEMDFHLTLLIPLSVLLVVESLFVSLDFYSIATSLVCLVLFFLLIRKDIVPVMRFIKGFLAKRSGGERLMLGKELTNNQLKEIQLAILKDVDAFCTEKNIPYSVYYGTLIGLIRHRGYIPWDDDIDIVMTRENYKRFLAEYQSERYQVRSMETDPDFLFTFAKIDDPGTILIENKKYQSKLGVNIDLFPIDGLPDNAEKRKKHMQKTRFLWKLINMKQMCWRKDRALAKKFVFVLSKCALLVFPYKTLVRKLVKESKRYSDGLCEYGANLSWGYGEKEIVPLNWINETERRQFENIEVSSTVHSDAILTKIYGDYMVPPPVEKRVTHHGFKAYYKD